MEINNVRFRVFVCMSNTLSLTVIEMSAVSAHTYTYTYTYTDKVSFKS